MQTTTDRENPQSIEFAGRILKDIDAIAKRSFWHRLVDIFFGYDFFVSYAWKDGAAYAVELAKALKSKGFDCFLDSESYARGDNWRLAGAAALRKTTHLVLIGTPMALQSEPVLTEVRVFTSTGRTVVPIDFDGTLDAAILQTHAISDFLKPEVLRITEDRGRLQEGPSDATVAHLEKTFDSRRQSAKRLRAFQIVAGVLTVSLVVAVAMAIIAEKRRAEAEAARAAADIANREGRRQFANREWQTAEALVKEGDALAAAHHYFAAATHFREAGDTERGRNPEVQAGRLAGTIVQTFVHDEPPPGADYTRDVIGAAYTGDGKRLLTWGGEKVFLWDLAAPDHDPAVFDQESSIGKVLFTGDGRRILTFPLSGGAVGLWNIDHPERQPLLFRGFEAQEGQLGPSDQTLLTWGQSGSPALWDLRNQDKPLATFWDSTKEDRYFVEGAAFAGGASRVLIWGGKYGSASGIAQGWDPSRPVKPLFTVTATETFRNARLTDDGRRLVTVGGMIDGVKRH